MEPQLVDVPNLAPHACIDGRQDGPVVLTGLNFRGYGVVYLSRQMLRDCTRLLPAVVEELAGEIGWVAENEHVEALRERDSTIRELEGRLAELAPVERAMNRLATDLIGGTERIPRTVNA